tara:strand:- start:753 stop:1589 length:837 start_codon:yes stop_codon:yes gene_type:complete
MAAMLKIAIQGIKGSFHHEAAQKLVDADPVECVTFQDVFDAVIKHEVDYGVVAIENSIHGSINHVYRLLERYNLWIAGETTLSIEQYLIGPQKVSVEELNSPDAEVRTMFPAFAQCELWLEENLPLSRRAELYDTAFSVQNVMDEGEPLAVAIAGKYAAKEYNGVIIAGPINDDPHNYTRFILLTKQRQVAEHTNRTSIIMTTGHTKGALYHALGAFAEAGINLSKLDSHPIRSDKRNYSFYIDLEAGVEDEHTRQAFEEIRNMGCTIKVLGSYTVEE